MDRERWKRIEPILDRALELPEERRESYLDEACAGDAELRAEIAALIAEDRGARGPLDATEGLLASALAGMDEPEVALPEEIGPYRIEAKLGEGGMGIVYRALQHDPRRHVALKVLRAGMDSRIVLARFEAERQALAVMDHPYIAKVFDAGVTKEGLPYFAMEHVDGAAITAYCDRGGLSTTARLRLFMAVCDAVQHAHRKGIIHRDLKPSNVMVTEQDGRPAPKVIDFGIAKAIDRDAAMRSAFTEHGIFLGTPEYMSPEQAALTPDVVDTRTDVYSLGVLLYELLTGLLPFEARQLRRAGFDEMRRIIRETDPPRPSTRLRTLDESRTTSIGRSRGIDASALARQLEGEVDWIVLRALEKDPTRRYGSPEAFAADIQRFLRHEAVEARPATRLYRLRKFVRRHRWSVGLAAAAAVGVVGFAGAMAWQAARVARERDRADIEARVASRALEFLRDVFEVASPRVARGKTVTARDVLDEAATRVETRLADEPRARATILYTLSTIYRDLGVFDRAIPLIEKTIELDNELVGPEHRATLRAYVALAKTYVAMGRDAEAVELCRRVEPSATRALGAEDELTLEAVATLAAALGALGHHAEAEPLLGRVYAWELEHHGAGSMRTAGALLNLARNLTSQGRSDDATPLRLEAIEAIEATAGRDHPETLSARNALAGWFVENGRLEEALAVVRENLESQMRVLGPNHPDTLMSINNLGGIAGALGRAAEVEALLAQGLRDAERSLSDHWLTHYLRFSYGQCLCFLGRYDEGEPLMLAALADMSSSRPNDPVIGSMKADLAAMYRSWGRPDEAAKHAPAEP